MDVISKVATVDLSLDVERPPLSHEKEYYFPSVDNYQYTQVVNWEGPHTVGSDFTERIPLRTHLPPPL
jgi:hypothetical protein